MVAVTAPVVLVYGPGTAPGGTVRLTLMVQEPSGARTPPVKLIRVVPAPATDPPHPLASRLLKERPERAAARSSVKAMSVAESSRSKLKIVKSSVTVPPGGTGSSTNDLARAIRVTVTSSVALALPHESASPPTVAVRSPETLSSAPMPVAVTSTTTVHVAPAATPGKVGVPR